MIEAFVGLGSNLGQPRLQIEAAVAALSAAPEIAAAECSPLYRSAAVGPGVQPDYCNAVMRVLTAAPMLVLFARLQAVEREHGRLRDGRRWLARTLDLDLLAYGERVCTEAALTVPHPRAHERAFVLLPWADLEPDAHIPGRGRVADLAVGIPAGDCRCWHD